LRSRFVLKFVSTNELEMMSRHGMQCVDVYSRLKQAARFLAPIGVFYKDAHWRRTVGVEHV
jgi:hypothetical protein